MAIFLQFLNASFPIVFILLGKLVKAKFSHPSNAFALITVILSAFGNSVQFISLFPEYFVPHITFTNSPVTAL